MPKKEDLEAEEEKVFKEFEEEAEAEVKNSKPINGKTNGIIALILSLVGIVFVFIFFPIAIILGFIGLIFAKKSIDNGFSKIGRIAGIICLLDILGFIGQVSGILTRFV